jgi:hypothetical protein
MTPKVYDFPGGKPRNTTRNPLKRFGFPYPARSGTINALFVSHFWIVTGPPECMAKILGDHRLELVDISARHTIVF